MSEPGRDTPTPFWGPPPNVETCEHWLEVVRCRIEDVERDLAVGEAGGELRDETRRVVPVADFARWLDEKLTKRDKARRRLRWLEAWRDARIPADARCLDTARGRLLTLEAFARAFRRWLDTDTDESSDAVAEAAWRDLLAAFEHVEGVVAEPAEPAA